MTVSVPCPREVWAAALNGREMTITVQPDTRSVESGGLAHFSGEITGRHKVGDAWATHVVIRFTPSGELAPIELESAKEQGSWEPFRAFHWQKPRVPTGPEDHRFMYVGEVREIDIAGVQFDSSSARERSEVSP